jgi:glycosyltransferase involved in cell wall biosynthesis
LDIGNRALQLLRSKIPGAEFHIYGDGASKLQLMQLAEELGLKEAVHFYNPVNVEDVPDLIAEADIGVVPKRADSFGNEAYSTKIMEFMAVGVPVVVSDTRIDRYYFDKTIVRFFESGNPEKLADAMFELLNDCELRRTLTKRASEYVLANNWGTRKDAYLRLVDKLCGAPNAASLSAIGTTAV